jgi:hypothetical protein
VVLDIAYEESGPAGGVPVILAASGINVISLRSILNQCFALGCSKYFCNTIGTSRRFRD